MHRLTIAAILLLLPFLVYAEENILTRANGFELIWTPLKRPPKETREPPFADVPQEHPSFLLLTYAKDRGVLDDESHFHPDESLQIRNALLWLLRSRNVDYPANITVDSLASFTQKYALVPDLQAILEENRPIMREELEQFIATLDATLREETHTVSFYGQEFAGQNTAFGEIFDPNAFTAAHRTLPHNTLVRVRHIDSGNSIVVRINDRGPYTEGRDMDLSLAAFEQLAPRSRGVLHNVTFERLGSADTVSACPAPLYQRRLGRITLTPGIPRTAPQGTVLILSADQSFRLIQLRKPGSPIVRSREWTRRGETLTISFEHPGVYTLILHEDGGSRRRFQTKVSEGC